MDSSLASEIVFVSAALQKGWPFLRSRLCTASDGYLPSSFFLKRIFPSYLETLQVFTPPIQWCGSMYPWKEEKHEDLNQNRTACRHAAGERIDN